MDLLEQLAEELYEADRREGVRRAGAFYSPPWALLDPKQKEPWLQKVREEEKARG